MNTYNTCIKPIESITGRKSTLPAGLTTESKTRMIKRHLNRSRYEFIGFVDRTNQAILRPRFYNVRDKQGRFAAVES